MGAKEGETMESFAALEKEIERLWPGVRLAVVRVRDKFGDVYLVLVTEKQNVYKEELSNYLAERGCAVESIPDKILSVHKFPLLDSGGTDYPRLTEFVTHRCERRLCPLDHSVWR